MPVIGNLGPTELIIILVIALLVIGPGKLPEVGAALGKSIREFRKAAADVKDAASLEPERPAPARVDAAANQAPVAAAPAAVAPVVPPVASPATPGEPVVPPSDPEAPTA